MPVGRRSSVWTSACLSSSRRTVSPAPPSKRTLSGTTIAAWPCCFRMVKTCWRKLSCLLLVLAQKSSRCTTSDCFSSSPASLTIVTLLFFPKGGLVRTISYSPCLPAGESLWRAMTNEKHVRDCGVSVAFPSEFDGASRPVAGRIQICAHLCLYKCFRALELPRLEIVSFIDQHKKQPIRCVESPFSLVLIQPAD